MSVRVITQDGDFSALQASWNELFVCNPGHRPYQSWEWNFTWWKHHGRAGDLRLIVVEEDGRLLGVAPLYLARRFRGLPLRHLRFIAHKRADYLDFPVRPGFETTFFRELFQHLRDELRGWRFLEIRDLPDTSPNLSFVQREATGTPSLWHLEPGEQCVTLPLTSTFEEYLASLSKRFRKDVGYYRRSFERSFASEFRAVSAPSEIPAALNDVIAVYKARWQETKGVTEYDEGEAARFEREISRVLSAAGMYQLYLLYADKKPAAGILAYVRNNRCYVERFAHSPEFHKYSVGTVLLAMAIEHAIARGCTEFDLMRGAEDYKFRWNGQSRQTYRVRLFRSRLMRRMVAIVDRLYLRAAKLDTLHKLRALYRRGKYARPSVSATRASGS
jgi:CelD/BcsL family acetyltransferase involved in cellulose biosynthesis